MLGATVRRTCSRSAVRMSKSSKGSYCPVRAFSTSDNEAAPAEKDTTTASGRQSFVTTEIEPQEWDVHKKDPLHRPKFRSTAKILSRHDFARQNGVSFEERYATFEDAMITLSWLDSKQQKRIYDNYLTWMNNAQETFGKTSHEYVCRLLAQRYNITPFRAAAVIQLQHNEQQFKLKNPDEDFGDLAEMADAYMINTIKTAYRSTGETPPESFVEPVQQEGGFDSWDVMEIPDEMDVDQLETDADIQEQDMARTMLNDHTYIEDIDDEARKIPMDKDSLNLVKMKEKLKQQAPDPPAPSPAVANSEEEKPPRWKFVAQIIDTRKLNPKIKRQYAKDGRKLWGKRHRNKFQQNWPENTLIEQHDGTLRPTNLAEVRHMSWKPVRHVQEHTYQWAKKGWLDRTVRGDTSAWGMAPTNLGQKKNRGEDEEDEDEGEDENVEAKEDGDAENGEGSDVAEGDASDVDASSSSSDEDDASSSDEDEGQEQQREENLETDDDKQEKSKTDNKGAGGVDANSSEENDEQEQQQEEKSESQDDQEKSKSAEEKSKSDHDPPKGN